MWVIGGGWWRRSWWKNLTEGASDEELYGRHSGHADNDDGNTNGQFLH